MAAAACVAGVLANGVEGRLPIAKLGLCLLQMDDWRLAVGCADGIVQVADLRRGQAAGGKLQAHAVLPAHQERVSAARGIHMGNGQFKDRAG